MKKHGAQSFRLAQLMFYITGVIWVGFGGATILNILRDSEGPPRLLWMNAIVMFGNAGLLIWVGRRLARKSMMSYLLALLVLGVNILLTVTDQFGFFDAIMLALNAGLFFLLIARRSRFLN